jgi:hypothetical protein
VIAAIAQDRAEVDVAELPIRIMAKLVGLAPGPIARLTQRKDASPGPTK